MRRRSVPWLLGLVAALLLAAPAAARQNPDPPRTVYLYAGVPYGTPPPEWGATERTWFRIGATELAPDTSDTTFHSTWAPGSGTFKYRRYVTGGFPHLIGFAHLPAGALVSSLNSEYCQSNASGPFGSIDVYHCFAEGSCPSTPSFHYDLGTFGAACLSAFSSGNPFTVDNINEEILIDVTFLHTDGSEAIASVGLGYELQVSPAPATATFGDVPTTDGAFQYIEALVASGVTAGCGGGNYCPDQFVTRRQMAVFIAKALGLDWANH